MNNSKKSSDFQTQQYWCEFTHAPWQHSQDLHRFKPAGVQTLRGGNRHGVQSAVKKLLAIDASWSLVYEPHYRAGPWPRVVSWPTQMKSVVCLGFVNFLFPFVIFVCFISLLSWFSSLCFCELHFLFLKEKEGEKKYKCGWPWRVEMAFHISLPYPC